jgi:hypothetical protein
VANRQKNVIIYYRYHCVYPPTPYWPQTGQGFDIVLTGKKIYYKTAIQMFLDVAIGIKQFK